MPVAYLDAPVGADLPKKQQLMKAIYDGLAEAYPYPDDHRIFLREWPLDSTSQNGLLGSEPMKMKPVLTIHGPQGAGIDAKRRMLQMINAAVADAYDLPDFMIFMHEYPLDLVAHEGGLLSDNRQRVDEQAKAYS